LALQEKCTWLSVVEVGPKTGVGVACLMAAAGVCAVHGGSRVQFENAVEIGMEHHQGLTCDRSAARSTVGIGLLLVPIGTNRADSSELA
jgi:L-serine deaminase